MNPCLFLDCLLDFTRRIRRFYFTLGDRAELPAEIRFFWNCKAEDERHSLAILERSAGLGDLIESPPQVSKETLTEIETKVAAAEVAAQRSDLSLDEALRLALTLESSGLGRLGDVWFQGFRPTLGSLLQALTPGEEGHLRRLVEAVYVFSGDEALRNHAATIWSAYQHDRDFPPCSEGLMRSEH
jgi:hypothetical protein